MGCSAPGKNTIAWEKQCPYACHLMRASLCTMSLRPGTGQWFFASFTIFVSCPVPGPEPSTGTSLQSFAHTCQLEENWKKGNYCSSHALYGVVKAMFCQVRLLQWILLTGMCVRCLQFLQMWEFLVWGPCSGQGRFHYVKMWADFWQDRAKFSPK